MTIKPGITGLAQVSGRSDLLFEEEVKLDVYYIENWSLLLDLSIYFEPLAILKIVKLNNFYIMKVALIHDHLAQDGGAEKS